MRLLKNWIFSWQKLYSLSIVFKWTKDRKDRNTERHEQAVSTPLQSKITFKNWLSWIRQSFGIIRPNLSDNDVLNYEKVVYCASTKVDCDLKFLCWTVNWEINFQISWQPQIEDSKVNAEVMSNPDLNNFYLTS